LTEGKIHQKRYILNPRSQVSMASTARASIAPSTPAQPPTPLPFSTQGLVQAVICHQRVFLTETIAQAMRMAGQGTPVLVVQFLKGGIGQGCDRPMVFGENLTWVRADLQRHFDFDAGDVLTDEERAAIAACWTYVRSAVMAKQFDWIVLDELGLAVEIGAIAETDVLTLLDQRPPRVEAILTGPRMPAAILEVADRVTEVRRLHCL
jgi:cob(I)alamin adenosyltransferase